MSYERKPASYPTLDKPLSDRGKNRLLTAHNLIWKKKTPSDGSLYVSPELAHERCMEALRKIESMPVADREKLKGHVDWVEDYGFEEPPLSQNTYDLSDEYDGEIVDPDVDEDIALMAMASVETAGISSQKVG